MRRAHRWKLIGRERYDAHGRLVCDPDDARTVCRKKGVENRTGNWARVLLDCPRVSGAEPGPIRRVCREPEGVAAAKLGRSSFGELREKRRRRHAKPRPRS